MKTIVLYQIQEETSPDSSRNTQFDNFLSCKNQDHDFQKKDNPLICQTDDFQSYAQLAPLITNSFKKEIVTQPTQNSPPHISNQESTNPSSTQRADTTCSLLYQRSSPRSGMPQFKILFQNQNNHRQALHNFVKQTSEQLNSSR